MAISNDGRWLILGHYGGHNTGDEAMLAGLNIAMGDQLRQRMTVVAGAGATGAPYADLNMLPARASTLLRALRSHEGVILGGGTHFQDDYTTKRYVRHMRYLVRLVVIFRAAKILRMRIVLLSMGFGPFFRSPTRLVTRLALSCADHVTVREATSHADVAGWIDTDRLALTFDLAALLWPCLGQDQPTSRPAAPVVGVSVTSVRSTHTGGAYADVDFRLKLADALTELLNHEREAKVRIFIIRGGSRDGDGSPSTALMERIAGHHPDRVELVPYHSDPNNTLHEMSKCTAFVAMRFHAALLAYLAGCDLLLLSYHRKVADLAREIGLSDNAVIHVRFGVWEDLITKRVQGVTQGGGDYRARLPVATAYERALSNVDILHRICDSESPKNARAQR